MLTEVENWNLFLDQYQGRVYEFEPIDGTVAISGNPVFGGILSADTSGVLPQGATLEYLWRRGAITVGTGRTYTVTQEDIGRQLTVTVTGYGRYYGGIRSSMVIPGKAVALPPAPPTVLSKTATSVTLNAQTGYEYRIGDGDWQTSGEFIGLDPNTEYLFYARTIETATHLTSPPSSELVVRTIAVLSGDVEILGTPLYGALLTADISQLLPVGATVNYAWRRGTEVVGETATYTVTQADIGVPLTVAVIGTGEFEGTIASESVVPGKAVALPPAPPTVLSKTAYSVTLNAQSGYEYRIGNGDWQTSGEFTGLDPNTEYLFYARTIETATHLTSSASAPLAAKTQRATISGVVVITGTPAVGEILTTDCSGVFPAGATVTYQWYSDGYLVSGETGNQYTVMEIDEGAKITVQVTGIGDYQGTLTSAQVTVN